VFKDHLVEWVTEYLESVHGKTHAKVILADIDQRCVIAIPLDHNETLIGDLHQHCCCALVSRSATVP
jgi:hypothetical protein